MQRGFLLRDPLDGRIPQRRLEAVAQEGEFAVHCAVGEAGFEFVRRYGRVGDAGWLRVVFVVREVGGAGGYAGTVEDYAFGADFAELHGEFVSG